MGVGFATNLAGRIRTSKLQDLEKLGAYIPLKLDGIDGGLIAAPVERRPTIVFVHGRSANRTELAPLSQALFAAGYNAVLWDSNSRQITYGPREVDEIRSIVASIRNDPHVAPDQIYVIGFSLGGAMALGAAAADVEHHIRAVIADSPYADLKAAASHYVTAFGIIPSVLAWPLRTMMFATSEALHGIDFETRNPADWAERVSCPVLLIHGKLDWRIPPKHSKQIFERLGSGKELWLVENAGHTDAFNRNRTEYLRRVFRFLSAARGTGTGLTSQDIDALGELCRVRISRVCFVSRS